ncbi:MAG: Kelch repeat-containing protein, partial [Myxococcota bacterium]
VDDFKQLPVPHSGGISFFNPTEEPLILAVMIGPGINITKLLIANNDINWVQSPNSLHYPRDGHKFVAIPDYRILIVGGGSEKMEIYNYKDDTISEAKDTIIDITGHQIINMSDSRILIAGGVDKNGVINQNTYIYDPINDSLSTTSQMNIPRKDFRLTLLHNGKVLASGGIDKDGNAISKLEIFDPASGRWSETLSLNIPRANHTAELIGAEGVLICGGNTGENTASIKNCEIYSPEKICTPGSFSCDGNWIVKCNSFGDGTNKTNECAGGCKDGQCIGGCTEGERRCRDIGVKIIVEICNATGGWVLLEQCEESCKNGYCDGQIPPRDAGVNDSGRDTLISDYYIEDHQTADEVLVEDIIINSDNGIIPDAAISDSFNNSNPSEGCSCNLIE